MERESLHGIGADQPLSLYKSHVRNPIVMEPYLSFPLSHGQGLLKAPPLSLQPPLLPLPSALPRRSSSCPAPAIRNGQKKTKNPSKPKNRNNTNNTRKLERETPKRSSDTVSLSTTAKFGSDTKKLPMNIAGVAYFDGSVGDSSLVFGISPPPPWSLPLPTFSLRAKLGCNAAVGGGIDAGATDGLRRLLRLQ